MKHPDRKGQLADELVLFVPAMTCRHCVRTISARLGDVRGVVAVEADLPSRTVLVRGTPRLEALRSAVADAGFEVERLSEPRTSGGLS